jgi:hypothetical protein
VALEEAETVARNLYAEVKGQPLEAFTFHDKGFVVSKGPVAASPTSPALLPAGGWPTCSRTLSSGRIASPYGTCAARTRLPPDGTPAAWPGQLTRSGHTVDQENVSTTLMVAVPAAGSAVLADPTSHSAIDGTG